MHGGSSSFLRRGEPLPELLRRRYAKETPQTDYAFEMACSNIRYGPGVTREVGMVSEQSADVKCTAIYSYSIDILCIAVYVHSYVFIVTYILCNRVRS